MLYGDEVSDYTAFTSNGSLRAVWRNVSDGQAAGVTNFAGTTGEWTFYAFVYDNENGRFIAYRNNETEGLKTAETATAGFNPNAIVAIGARNSRGSLSFAGAIDDVRVYNSALTQEEITALYNSYTDTEAPSIPENLTAEAVSISQVDLSWLESTDNVQVAGYKIYMDGSYLKQVASHLSEVTGLEPDTAYIFQVSAIDAAGNESAKSELTAVTTYPVYYTLTVEKTGNGSVTPLSGQYEKDTDVVITAQADTGWSFFGWSGDLSGEDNPENINMNSDKSVTANFTQNYYTLNVVSNENGNVSLYPLLPTKLLFWWLM